MTDQLVAVDIGNTSVKVGVTAAHASGGLKWTMLTEVDSVRFTPEQFGELASTDNSKWRVVSVHRSAERRLADWVAAVQPDADYRLLAHNDLPITVEVEFPDRVGMDRLVAAVAANELRQRDRPAIVIDAGTAITVDLLSSDGVFQGGIIMPGPRIASRALAEFTDLLPVVDSTFHRESPPLIGKSTDAAIRSGLFWGSVGAIQGLLDRASTELASPPEVFLTGGDARFFTEHLETGRYVADLVLMGIALAALDG